MKLQAKLLRTVSRLMSFNMLMWLTMLVLFAAILFIAAAAYMAMVTVLAPALAALFTGFGLFGLFIALAIAIYTATQSSAAAKAEERSASSSVQETADHDSGASHTTHWLEKNPELAVAGALVAGVALVASPGLRRLVVRSAGLAVTRSSARVLQNLFKKMG